jgi:hypothetical protein
MIDFLFPQSLRANANWSRAATDLMRRQWEFFDAQCRFGIKMFNTLLCVPEGKAPLPEHKSEDKPTLEDQAKERMRQGFAPPREIYEVQNRGRIDWSKVPDWARPSDPELFEGCQHEG